jgi:hypothetical protein
MVCPNCRGAMEPLELDGHLGRKVSIDLCHDCQAFWFDKYESLQLSAPAVLQLFRIIGKAGGVKTGLSQDMTCVRCPRKLRLVKDMQRATRFEYRGCPDNHGRLITFFNFLREKDFIRPLTPAQVDDLRRNVKTINCSNCGAPIDLARGSFCAHCGSPLSMIDVAQAGELVAKLREAGNGPQAVDRAALGLELTKARRDVNAAFASFERAPDWYGSVEDAGLVGAAISKFVAWLT